VRIDNLFRIIGRNYKPEGIGLERAVIQFEIGGYCVYQVTIQDRRIACKKGGLLPATCIVELDEVQLDNIIRDPTYMTTLWDAGRIKISNPGDVGLLLRIVEWASTLARVHCAKYPGHPVRGYRGGNGPSGHACLWFLPALSEVNVEIGIPKND
jgi:hypothetical protein